MRKVLFVYDAKVMKDENKKLYTNGTVTEKNWKERYCNYGHVTFISFLQHRIVNHFQAIEKYSLIPSDVTFIPTIELTSSINDFLSYSKRKKNKKTIESVVKKNDIIIARLPSYNAYIAIKYAKKYNKIIVAELVGSSFSALWHHSFKGKVLSIFSFFRQRYYTKISPNVIYVTEKYLQGIYPTNGHNIGCSDVELPHIDDCVMLNRISKIKNISSKNKIVIGTCGAIDVKYKGHEYVIRSIYELIKQGINNIEYQIVGPGDSNNLMKLLEKYNIHNYVKIIGPLRHEDVFEWLKKIDIYIQPSNTEGLCRSLLEAMSVGLPCIASNVGGNSELIDYKYLFKKKHYKECENKIKELLRKDEMMKQSKINYNKSQKYKSIVLNQKRKEFYNKVIENANF